MSLSSGVYKKTPLNISEIPPADLNIANKLRSNPLTWKGQFSPQLIQVLLASYAKRGTRIFDPFLGSGTVLLESGRIGVAACGTDINPAAINLAQIYKFINVPRKTRRFHLDKVQKLLLHKFPGKLPLFPSPEDVHGKKTTAEIKQDLTRLLRATDENMQSKLLASLIVLLDFHKPKLSTEKIFTAWNRLTKLVIELPYSKQLINVYHADARHIPLPTSSIDLVITSPPYINVLNYHQQYRASMEALNWDILKIARSEIGSNRKHRSNRFLTVIQYCLDFSQVLHELSRVTHPHSRLIFIVGRESTVRGTKFLNSEIVAEVAYRTLGFNLILKQERVFLNRFGQNIFEDILHFSPATTNSTDQSLPIAQSIAREVLKSALKTAPARSREDIKIALDKLETVKPSPIFKLQNTVSQ